jgi:phage shock protein C
MMKKRFFLDKTNGMALGVCAGLGRFLGVDPTFVRIGAVVVTVLGAFPWTLIAYGIAAFAAKKQPAGGLYDQPAVRGSTHDLNANFGEHDRRLAEVDTYLATSNTSLAREIDGLR